MHEEGWYVDPFGRHEARWISDGVPTALVRDHGSESLDPPPDEPFPGPLHRVAESTPADGEDLRRADDADVASFDPAALTQAAEDAIDSTPGF